MYKIRHIDRTAMNIRDTAENIVLQRLYVDAQEILRSDPERFVEAPDDAVIDDAYDGTPMTVRGRLHRQRLAIETAKRERTPDDLGATNG